MSEEIEENEIEVTNKTRCGYCKRLTTSQLEVIKWKTKYYACCYGCVGAFEDEVDRKIMEARGK